MNRPIHNPMYSTSKYTIWNHKHGNSSMRMSSKFKAVIVKFWVLDSVPCFLSLFILCTISQYFFFFTSSYVCCAMRAFQTDARVVGVNEWLTVSHSDAKSPPFYLTFWYTRSPQKKQTKTKLWTKKTQRLNLFCIAFHKQ